MRSCQQQPSTLGVAFQMERQVSVQSLGVGSWMVYCVQRAKEGRWAGVRLPGERGLEEEGEGAGSDQALVGHGYGLSRPPLTPSRPLRLSQGTGPSLLCHRAVSHWLSVLHMVSICFHVHPTFSFPGSVHKSVPYLCPETLLVLWAVGWAELGCGPWRACSVSAHLCP